MYTRNRNWLWVVLGVLVLLLLIGALAYAFWPRTPTPAAPTNTPTPAVNPPAAPKSTAELTPAPSAPGDPLSEALTCLGFNSTQEVINNFQMVGVDPAEVALVPDGQGGHEQCAVRILREKNAEGVITPFRMTNPTSATFDGWRAAGQQGGQAKVPPGTWLVEGVTIRPWR